MSIEHKANVPTALAAVRKNPGLYLGIGSVTSFYRVDEAGNIFQVDPKNLEETCYLRDNGWSDEPATQNMRVFSMTLIERFPANPVFN